MTNWSLSLKKQQLTILRMRWEFCPDPFNECLYNIELKLSYCFVRIKIPTTVQSALQAVGSVMSEKEVNKVYPLYSFDIITKNSIHAEHILGIVVVYAQ